MFLCLFLYGWWRASKGFDLTDEGMYISTGMRYTLGDLPFRDEVMNILRPFDILVSVIFRVNPHISLFHMRIVGLSTHMLAIIVFFLLVSRYSSPVIASLLCSVVFLINNFFGIMTPSYNLLSNAFSLLAISLWLLSTVIEKKRLILAAGAGLSGAVAVLSYLPLMGPYFLLLLYMAFLIFNDRNRRTVALLFISSFSAGIALFFFYFFSSGIWSDWLIWYKAVIETNLAYNRGLFTKFLDVLRELRHNSLSGIGTITILSIGILCAPGRSNFGNILLAILILIFQMIAYCLIFLHGMQDIRFIPLNMIVFSIFLALALIVYDRLVHPLRENDHSEWPMVRNLLFLWGLLLAVTCGVSSNNGIRNFTRGAAFLFVPAMLFLWQIITIYLKKQGTGDMRMTLRPLMIIIVILFFLGEALYFNYNTVYRDLPIRKLTAEFSHQRLKGIYSTPDKVRTVEELLRYMDKRVSPGSYLLAFNYIPMIYYLMGARPAYLTVWARDDWALPFREKLYEQTMERGKISEYCVRMLAEPEDDWKRAMPYEADSLLDSYVKKEYYLENIIYPFEIWHRGNGPALRLFRQKPPDWHGFDDSWNWNEEAVDLSLLEVHTKSCVLFRRNGEFTFRFLKTGREPTLQITCSGNPASKVSLAELGYRTGARGFPVTASPGQTAVIIITMRLSHPLKNTATLFVEDSNGTPERNNVSLGNKEWTDYIVGKRVRDGATSVSFGLSWQPEEKGEQLEVKNVTIYVNSSD